MPISFSPTARFRKRLLFLLGADLSLFANGYLPAGVSGTQNDLYDYAGVLTELIGGQYWLTLFPKQDSASLTLNYPSGNAPQYDILSSGFSYSPSARQYGLKCTIIDSNRNNYRAIRRLANLSQSTGYASQVPLTMLDFLFPEEADEDAAMTAGTEPFTQRRVLVVVTPKGMAGNSTNLQFNPGGFDLEVQEASLRVGLV